MRRTCAQTANGALLSQTVEDGFGRTIEESVPSPAGNLITTRSEYNERGQLIRRTRTDGNTEQAPTLYEYDHAGRISRQITALNGTPTPENSAITEYTYSAEPADNGLVYAVTRTTRYNAATEAGTSTAYTSNRLNQYTAEGSFRPTFDADGNQTLIKTSTGTWNVTYNAKNRPIRFVKSDNSVIVECTYDTMGRRATKKVTTNGTLTENRRFLYRGYLQIDSPPPHRRLTPSGQSRFAHCPTGLTAVGRLACCDLTRAYTPALWYILWDPTQDTATRPLAIQKNGTWYSAPARLAPQGSRSQVCSRLGVWLLKPHPAYGRDLTKNICETYRTDGRIDLAYTYTPYGEVSPAHAYDQPLRWSSEYHDVELGLVYYNYRHYNPAMGRWMGRDSHPDGVNNYRFIYNALFAVDILGLKTQVFRWVGNWYDDEGGPGIGNYSDDVLFAHVDFKLELECGCYDIPYNHVPKDEEEGTKLVNSARYPFLVEYGADFHLQASNYDPITSKKTFVLKSRVTMAATLGYFLGIAVVSTGIGYGVGAVFAANSVIVGTSFLANVASGIAGAGLKRNGSATKILIIDVECPSGKNVMPRISYKVDPDSTAGSRESTTFGGRRKNELYLLDQIQWIN